MIKLLLKTALVIPGAFCWTAFSIGMNSNSYAQAAEIIKQQQSFLVGTPGNADEGKLYIIAQSEQPNRDRFLQPERELITPEDEKFEPILPRPEPTVIPEPEVPGEDLEFYIREIVISGSTVFSEAELNELSAPLKFKKVKLSELRKLAQEITSKYLENGHITSRAIVPQQEIKQGIVEIKVIEGSIANIKIDGNQHLNESFIRDRLELGAKTPVKVDSLEGQLQLLRSNQAIENIEANIQPAPESGASDLDVKVRENSRWQYGLEVNNYSTVATGAERAILTLGSRNLTGNGDRLTASFEQALSASSWSLDTSYSVPVNPQDGIVQLRADINRNEIVGDFEDLSLEGDSELYEISYRQPISRSFRKEVALSSGFSFQESRDFFNGVLLSGTNRSYVLKLGQDLTSRDPQGVWALRSQFNIGVDDTDETDALNQNTADQPDDVFVSWLGQAQRLQRISPGNILVFQGDLQLSPSNLSPLEQFSLGGARSVRGFRQNARLGESGFRLSIEDRITVLTGAENPLLQVAPFADIGAVWSNSADLEDNFLAGIGLGLIAQPLPGLNMRLDYAPPLVDLDDTGDNIQEDGFYFRVNYSN